VAFVLAVMTMIYSLYGGLQNGFGTFNGWGRLISNALLLIQFPLIHSLLLGPSKRSLLDHCAPRKIARQLQPTTYVLIASVQLLAVFFLWSPSREIVWEATGALLVMHVSLFILAWVLLGKSMYDAHLGIQTGYIGWLTVWRNEPRIRWPKLPTTGLFRVCRQPIYFSFMLTLWTGPVWTWDKFFMASIWTAYCYWGPELKEQRLARSYGEEFEAYRARVPYWPAIQTGAPVRSPAHPRADNR
jgi:protein-S-isoprenylcysteine O-methyltransferase Ste14